MLLLSQVEHCCFHWVIQDGCGALAMVGKAGHSHCLRCCQVKMWSSIMWGELMLTSGYAPAWGMPQLMLSTSYGDAHLLGAMTELELKAAIQAY